MRRFATPILKFFCVTPCLDCAEYVRETMLSVIRQEIFSNLEHELHYVVVDGMSRDNTQAIIRDLQAECGGNSNVRIDVISEPDEGLYDALVKGFRRDTGSDVYSYLNAGDLYSPHAYAIVADIIGDLGVNFLTGLQVRYNRHGHVTDVTLPFDYNTRLLQCGFYGRELGFLQQESTFWTRSVHGAIDLDRLATCRLAGDFLIWRTLALEAPLYVVSAWLGGFRIHPDQLSQRHAAAYAAEVDSLRERRKPTDYLLAAAHWLPWRMPNGLKTLFSRRLLRSDLDEEKYQLKRRP
jgi:glycosyltransferase involved in cell wall biosynthesis